jgi:flagellar hook-basal body complex protein FliE
VIPALGIGPLGTGEWSVSGVGGLGAAATSTSGQSAGTADGSFGDALTNAIGSLENSQDAASTASQQLATGQLTDPTTAITAVENASLTLDFAAQVRNQLDSAAQTLFSTQM